ncbi:FG-GAP-like repeat-containing protein [Crocinitomix catalasitica]|uniref:FG-GAP-like repeat-containing protein n=1 Tax=Crocinitomix catalasitica TaxID=184607 RepID=UPI0004802DC6|nr:FG-GAP-like repeat-containing protein [Crocinitomix catalasitica]
MRFYLIVLVTLLNSFYSFGQFGPDIELTKSMAGAARSAALDYDSDGDDDIFVFSNDDNKFSCFENIDGEIFSEQITLSITDRPVSDIKVYDFDNDGLEDIIGYTSPNFVWFKNNGDGSFEQESLPTTHYGPRIMSYDIFDVNGDELGDLVVLGTLTLTLQINLGGGLFSDKIIIEDDYLRRVYSQISSADIDGDGNLDFMVTTMEEDGDSTMISWYQNIDGEFPEANEIMYDRGWYRSIEIIDFDEDGDLDLVTCNIFAPSKLVWFENLDGAGTYSDEILISDSFSFSNIIGFNIIDIDQDGDFDFIIFGDSGFLSPSVTVYCENISGELGDEQPLEDFGNASLISFSNDLNGDLYPELIYGLGAEVNILTNDAGTLAELRKLHTYYKFRVPTNLIEMDVDNDGDFDIIAKSYADSAIAWFEKEEGIGFGEYHKIDSNAVGIVSMFTGDIDNDGIEDIVYASETENEIYWKKNLGGGLFEPRIIVTTDVMEPQCVIVFDVDDDGDLDIVSASVGDDKIAWYANDGSGTFGPQIIISTSIREPLLIRSTDIDMDGKNDILCISNEDEKLAWYKNLDGVFSLEINLSDDIDSFFDFWVEDLDGDDDIDIIVSSFNNISWYENNDDGSFLEPKEIYAEGNNFRNVYACDIDLDGDKDVLYYKSSSTLGVCLNLGNESFAPGFKIKSNRASSIVFSDLDNDTDFDIIYSDFSSDQINLIENYYRDPFQVRGDCYVDANNNGFRDSLEVGVNFGEVFSTPETFFSFAHSDGKYFVNFDSEIVDSYIIEPTVPDLWSLSSDSAVYNVYVDEDFIYRDSLDFGFYPEIILDTLSNDITGGFPRCNTVINYWLTIKNEGTTVPSGIAHLILDDDISFVDSELAPDSIVGQNIYWSYDSLNYFDDFQIVTSVEMPSFLAMGDTLMSVFIASADSLGRPVFETFDTLNQVLVCAYDPNDKMAEPAGIDSLGYIPTFVDQIDYTIRFQNTGNDTAVQVRIEDQLDSNLNWLSIEPISSSHNMSIRIDPGGKVEFFFKDIMLPDSNVNELKSHGFVKYRIYLAEELERGTEINNTAEIYFDFNPPIITNTKIHTLYDCNDIMESLEFSSFTCENNYLEASLAFIPPNTDISWNIDDIRLFEGGTLNWLADTSGNFEINLSISTDFCEVDSIFSIEVSPVFITKLDTMFICPGDSILIFDNYETEIGTYSNPLTTFAGCDSTVVTYLMLNDVYTSRQYTYFCEGDSVFLFGEYIDNIGLYRDTLSTEHGCDSIIITNVTKEDISILTETVTICPDESIFLYGEYRTLRGVYSDTLSTFDTGCDSILKTILRHWNVASVYIYPFTDETICEIHGSLPISGSPSGGSFYGPGVSGEDFSPSIAGVGEHTIYYQYEDDNGCSKTDSMIVTVESCLGITNNSSLNFQIYPNPSKGSFTIKSPENIADQYLIQIHDISGKSVYSESIFNEGKLTVNTKNWSSGLYIIKIQITDHTLVFTDKLVVE